MDDDIFFQPRRMGENKIFQAPIFQASSVTDDSEYGAQNAQEFQNDPLLHYSGLTARRFQPVIHHQRRDVKRTVVYNLSQCASDDFVSGTVVQVTDQRTIENLFGFNSSSENVLHHIDETEGIDIYVMNAESTEKYLQIKSGHDGYYCLRIRQEFRVEKIHEQLQNIHTRFSAIRTYNLIQRHLQAVKQNADIVVLYKGEQMAVCDLCRLPSLAVVELLLVTPVLWRISYRYKLFLDKRCQVQCSSLDSLTQVKCKFLDLWQRSGEWEGLGPLSDDHVWFTQGSTLVTETQVKDAFLAKRAKGRDCLQVTTIAHLGVCVDEVWVHFQPPDAMCASVMLTSHSGPTAAGMLVVSPQQSPGQLREALARLVCRQPESLRIMLGNIKLDNSTNLIQALTAPDCTITVTPKDKICLTVHVLCASGEKTVQIYLYSNDSVSALKAQLSSEICLPPQKLDVLLEGRLLHEGSMLREHRLRNHDILQARVFPGRRNLSVLTADRQWQQVIVDDCRTATVGQLKTFCQSLNADHPGHSCEMTVLVGDRVLSDTEILGDVVDRLPESYTPRLVMLRTQNICFTADTAYRGTYIVCSSTKGVHFDLTMTMFNGEDVLSGGTVEYRKVLELLEKRRCQPPPQPVPGFHLLNEHHLPVTQARTPPLSTWNWSQQEMTSQTPNSHAASVSRQSKRVLQAPDPVDTAESVESCQHESQQRDGVRSNAVRFHTGNSLSDLANDVFAEDQHGEASEDVDGEEDADEFAGDQVCSVDGKDVGHEPSRVRSKSCPPCRRRSRPASLMLDKHYDSDSALGAGKIAMKRVTTCSERFTPNNDGTVTIDQVISQQTLATPEYIREYLKSSYALLPRSLSLGNGGSEVVLYQSQQSAPLTEADPAYKNIKAETIQWLAKHLGKEGAMVMRGLGVTENIIIQAQTAHPRDIVEQHQYCLRNWCTKNGARANKHTLRLALEKEERKDLAEGLDRLEPDPTSPSLPQPPPAMMADTEYSSADGQ